MKKFRTPLVILIAQTVLVASLVLAYLSFMIGFSGLKRENATITYIFLAMWAVVPIIAALLKSKRLFKLFYVYWIAATVSGALVWLIPVPVPPFLFILAMIFIAPIVGIDYFPVSTGAFALLLFLIPLCILLYGFLVKRKFFKEEPQNEQQ